MTQIYEHYPGKDYIGSDIHGHFSLLAQQLEQINFDEQTVVVKQNAAVGFPLTQGFAPFIAGETIRIDL